MTYEQVASITPSRSAAAVRRAVRRRAGLRLLARQQEALRGRRRGSRSSKTRPDRRERRLSAWPADESTSGDRRRDHRPRVGRHQGAEQAAAEMVALDLLCLHRLGHRLLAALCRPGRWCRATPRACSATASARRWPRSSMQAKAAQGRVPADRSPHSDLAAIKRRPRAAALRAWPAARRRSATTARPATAAARRARSAIPTCDDDSGSGAARSRTSTRPSASASAPTIPKTRAPAQMPRFGRDGLLTPPRSTTSPNMCCRCRAEPATRRRRHAAPKIFAEQLRRLPRRGRQGQPGARRAQPHRRALALWRQTRRPSSRASSTGRGGVMPAWAGRLDPVTIKVLAVYVHSLGGGQ